MTETTATTSNGSDAIYVEHVFHRFASSPDPILDDVSVTIKDGELVALIGPSGCGKSTLLNAMAGLVKITGGRIQMPHHARIAYVFQHPRLLPWRSVLHNVTFGLEQQTRGRRTHAILERARRAISTVNLNGHEDKYPHQLSGGMQQRVALARGLAIDPRIFLLDEPFGALDALTRTYLQEELLQLVGSTSATTVLVTHDIDEALLLADRILVMSSRPGRIKAEIPVPFERGRTIDQLVAEPEYPALRTRLRQLLRPEAQDAMVQSA